MRLPGAASPPVPQPRLKGLPAVCSGCGVRLKNCMGQQQERLRCETREGGGACPPSGMFCFQVVTDCMLGFSVPGQPCENEIGVNWWNTSD